MDPLNLPQQTVSGMAGSGELSLYQYFTASPLFADFKDFNSPERKIFLSEYTGMSQSLKNFLASTETATSISSVGLSYNLDDNQVSKVAGTLRELILGKIFIKDLPITISSKLGIDDIKAGEIVNKIVSQSFGPIIEDVKRIQRGKFPDKVMSMQKESQPTGLSPKPSVPGEVKKMPLTQPGARQDVQSVRPPASTLPPIQSQLIKPSQPIQAAPQQTPTQPPAIPAQPPKPEPIPNLPVQSLSPPSSLNPLPPRPPIQMPPKTQFKVPDLGQPISKSGSPQTPQSSSGQTLQPGSGQTIQKSLEAELEKVANIIDLRAKSEE